MPFLLECPLCQLLWLTQKGAVTVNEVSDDEDDEDIDFDDDDFEGESYLPSH